MSDGPFIYIIAGEPSGDFLGGRLMAALQERTGGRVRFAGIGGAAMAAQGLESRVPIAELAIMGVAEVLPRAARIFRIVRETVADVLAQNPDAVVTIDSSGFTWRVAHGLRRRGARLPLIHYVAPMVWAWRAGRARRMARWYDHLMALLPFEPPYFAAVGLSCHYVGHPVVESGADKGDGAGFRRRHGVAPDAKLIILLPGSRAGEVGRLLPIFRATVELLAARYPDLVVALPTTENVDAAVRAGVEGLSRARHRAGGRAPRNTMRSRPATRRSPPRARWRSSSPWRAFRRWWPIASTGSRTRSSGASSR